MWDLATGTDSVTLPDGVGEDVTLAFSPDGNLLAAPNTDTNIRVWNSQTGSLMATLGQLPLAIFGLVFSADGQHMAGAGVDLRFISGIPAPGSWSADWKDSLK